ncbi:Plasma membrane iron permease [Schizosaccharomyces pombe]|uniref:Plasma membrane iron permease n=2 Tax=Schizosaccharomyces pombe TaxID=4896 RepID=FIP1_SCHPO|nr:Fe permease Fip1 [Schizosaccharomyces pombe]Q09919.1 RecName: Full=Plasma membrane iron permease [Schizosaccharomyces pombe 972h-]CAA91954.1 iron permease Fip1 [Schizosaccharomyces pombe]|eukprot:NP_594493.1 Fe permease Fip1 [Schizosaccharomyces pombe]
MAKDVFSVAIFFIVLRETLEASIIVSVLMSFISQTLMDKDGNVTDPKLKRKFMLQVWIGSFTALFICLAIGGGFIGAFYALDKDIWSGSEEIWEGVFSLIAVVLITVMGFAMLRVSHLQEKWRKKLMKSIANRKAKGISNWGKKYSMFLLPFFTVLREGLEVVVFVGGVGLETPATAFPLPVICGLIVGCLIGYFIYRGGNVMNLQWFLIASTCILYLISAGLMSKATFYFEMNKWNHQTGGDAGELGDGPGSYPFKSAVWHVNYGNPEMNSNGGYMIFNAILGWNNTGTYGSILSYIIYWLFVAFIMFLMWYKERRAARLLIAKLGDKVVDLEAASSHTPVQSSSSEDEFKINSPTDDKGDKAIDIVTEVRESSSPVEEHKDDKTVDVINEIRESH